MNSIPNLTISFGQTPATTTYAGLAPDYIGLYQFNFAVPDVPDGDYQINISAGTVRAIAQPDYTKFLDPNGLRGARIGVARKYFGFNEQVDRLMAAALDTMKRLGAEIIDPADIPTTGKFGDSEMEVNLYEFKAALVQMRGGGR